MERLDLTKINTLFSYREAAIHISRYAPILPFVRGRHVLDVGCGEGYASRFFIEAGALSYTGIDASEDAVLKADELYSSEKVMFHQASAENFLFEGKTKYGIISAVESLEHFDHPKFFLSYLERCCTPTGLIYITVPNDHLYFGLPVTMNKYHMKQYSFDEFSKLLSYSGFVNKRFGLGVCADGFLNKFITNTERGEDSIKHLVDDFNDSNDIFVRNDNDVLHEEAAYFLCIMSNTAIPNCSVSGAVSTVSSSLSRPAMGVDKKRRLSRNFQLCLVVMDKTPLLEDLELEGVSVHVLYTNQNDLFRDLLVANNENKFDLINFIGELASQMFFDLVRLPSNTENMRLFGRLVSRKLSVSHLESSKSILKGSPAGFYDFILDDISGPITEDHIRTMVIKSMRSDRNSTRIARKLWLAYSQTD